jgi:hypothetical protein
MAAIDTGSRCIRPRCATDQFSLLVWQPTPRVGSAGYKKEGTAVACVPEGTAFALRKELLLRSGWNYLCTPEGTAISDLHPSIAAGTHIARALPSTLGKSKMDPVA